MGGLNSEPQYVQVLNLRDVPKHTEVSLANEVILLLGIGNHGMPPSLF